MVTPARNPLGCRPYTGRVAKKEAKEMNGWTENPGVMHVWSGKEVNLQSFSEDMVDIHDIAYSLNKICRFNGHINQRYTVLEHSLVGAQLADTAKLRLEALLHDAAEAYIGDIIWPLKALLPEVEEIENRIAGAIFNVLAPELQLANGIYRKSEPMNVLDRYMGMCEAKQFRPHHPSYAGMDELYFDDWFDAFMSVRNTTYNMSPIDLFIETHQNLRNIINEL